MKVLSYGGGVQSTAIACLAIDGGLEKPDAVVFADTGSELPSTYATVSKLKDMCEAEEIPFHIVVNDLGGYDPGQNLHEWYKGLGRLPMVGSPRCTFQFKIYPVRRWVKERCDQSRRKPWAESWIGITTDERARARPSEIQWMTSRYPLLELDMSRDDCIHYLEENWPDLVVSKSGCFCCPYQSGKKWARLRREHPDLFQQAVEMEEAAKANGVRRGLWGARSIIAFDTDVTLSDFGFEMGQPIDEDFECDSGGCFL